MKVIGAFQSAARRATSRAIVLSTALALSACGLGHAGEAEVSPSASESPRVVLTGSTEPVAGGRDTNRLLALADPGDEEDVDHQIRAYQARAEKLGRVDDWTLLGRAWVRKARDTANPGFYLNAGAAAEVLLAKFPDNVLGLGLRAQVAVQRHDFKTGLSTSEVVLGIAPEDLVALAYASDASLELGRYADAVEYANKMVGLTPNLPSYSRASYLSWLHGDEDKAIDAARRAIQSGNDPSDPEPQCYAYVQAANIFFHKGDFEGADAGYSAALKPCVDYPAALAGRGRVAVAMGDPKRGADLLALAYQGGHSLLAAVDLYWARLEAGDVDGAAAIREEIVARGERDDPRTFARFLADDEKDLDKAVELARAEMQVRPNLYTADVLAWALFKRGDVVEAARAGADVLGLKTPDATLEYHAGRIAIATGERERGRKLLERALARSGGHFDERGARDAKRVLESLEKTE
ncbi:MAG: hypothetical protein U0271_13405 [Polyangiaceae bacterium]